MNKIKIVELPQIGKLLPNQKEQFGFFDTFFCCDTYESKETTTATNRGKFKAYRVSLITVNKPTKEIREI